MKTHKTKTNKLIIIQKTTQHESTINQHTNYKNKSKNKHCLEQQNET